MATNETKWTLDGEEIPDFGSWLRENSDALTVEDALRFATMKPGDETLVGGGAGAEFALRRVG